MLPIRTILFATDFSDTSTYVFPLACALARDYGARLVVLHVAAPPFGIYTEGVYVPPLEEYAEPLHDQLLRLQPHDETIVTEHELVEGEPAPTILRVAAAMKADVIIMGTHGRTGLGRLLMGSVAEQVVRKAPCPVLTLKKPARKTSPEEQVSWETASEVAMLAK